MVSFKKSWEVFTTNEDWKECFYDEDEAYKIADKVGGEVKLCYFFEEAIAYPTSSDGEFIGFLIEKDGELYGEDEIEEMGEG